MKTIRIVKILQIVIYYVVPGGVLGTFFSRFTVKRALSLERAKNCRLGCEKGREIPKRTNLKFNCLNTINSIEYSN